MPALRSLMDAHISRTVIASISLLTQSPMSQNSSDNGHATDWHLVHIGVRTLSSLAQRWVSGADGTGCLVGSDRVSRRAAPAASSWRRPRSCLRAASPRRTRGSGRTRRSRLSGGSSTLRIRRMPRSVFSSYMRAARRRRSPRGSSRAWMACTVRIPRLPLPTRGDGRTTVYATRSQPLCCIVDVSRLQFMGLWLFLGRTSSQFPR
jgi:hypothetical protein